MASLAFSFFNKHERVLFSQEHKNRSYPEIPDEDKKIVAPSTPSKCEAKEGAHSESRFSDPVPPSQTKPFVSPGR